MSARISSIILVSILFMALGGVFQAATADTEANKAIVQRMFDEIWNKGNLAIVDEIFDADYVLHDPAGGEVRGPEEFKQFMTAMGNPFPDSHVTIEDMVAEGDKVATRRTYTGTHQGEFMGIPPTGSRVTVTVIDIHRLLGGKVVESWLSYDVLGMLQQLGVIPPMPDGLPFMDREGEDFLWDPDSDVTGDPGDPEANKALYLREIEEVWHQGNLDVVDETFSANFVNHDPYWGAPDRESYKQWVASQLASPSHLTIDDIVAEGDKVACRWTSRFTDSASGKQVTCPGVDISRFADGKIVERWWAKDILGVLQQMGLVPPLGPTAVESRTWGQVKSLFE